MSSDTEEYYLISDPPSPYGTKDPILVKYSTNNFQKALIQLDINWGLVVFAFDEVWQFRYKKGQVFFDLEVDKYVAMLDTIKESPYRVSAAIERVVGPKFGLIKKTGAPWWVKIKTLLILLVASISRHRCNYPGHLSQFWNWIKGTPFEYDSVFRCKCGRVYKFTCGSWVDYPIDKWKYFGGEE